ncbi:unnamed protein product [Absidia cylindrospora]
MSATTPHRTVSTPTSRKTFTPCTRMNNLTLNSQSGVNRTKMINCRPAFDFEKRIFEIAGEEDDTPEHPNLTMVLGPQKISFDQLLDDDHTKTPFMLLSDDEDSDEEINETSNTFSPCRMSLSPDRGFPTTRMMEIDDDHTKDNNNSSSPLLFHKKPSSNDPHYDPHFSFADGIYEEDEQTQSNESTTTTTLDLTSMSQTNDNENTAPSLWLKHFDPTIINMKKTPIPNNNSNSSSSTSQPLQEIIVNNNLPPIFDEVDEQSSRHTQKKKVVGDRPHRMRMMRSLSPTREDMRKGKEPSQLPSNDNIDPSVAFFL